jgi:hypothetical protein
MGMWHREHWVEVLITRRYRRCLQISVDYSVLFKTAFTILEAETLLYFGIRALNFAETSPCLIMYQEYFACCLFSFISPFLKHCSIKGKWSSLFNHLKLLQFSTIFLLFSPQSLQLQPYFLGVARSYWPGASLGGLAVGALDWYSTLVISQRRREKSYYGSIYSNGSTTTQESVLI